MSAAGGAVWAAGGDAAPALARLHAAVRALTRAHRQQLLVDCACVGLFFGLCASCAAVLAIRVADLPASPLAATALLVAAGLGAAAVAAWRRRPDNMTVAIRADLRLRLEQRLSTAWELVRRGADPALCERLARQAVRARIPARCDHVFPLRVGTWGRLVPVAAAALALVSVVDVRPQAGPAVAVVPDRDVAAEGARLREYGRRMESRARRDGLARSAAGAGRMQRLGSRMESGALSRREVLDRLRGLSAELDEERRAALRDAEQIRMGPVDVDTMPGGAGSGAARLRAMLRDLLDGRLDPGRASLAAADEAALERAGVSPEELQRALEDLRDGDGGGLEEILERLAREEQAGREARELARAQAEVERARGSLGDRSARDGRGGEPGTEAAAMDDAGSGDSPFPDVPEGLDGDGSRMAGPGAGDAPQGEMPARESPALPDDAPGTVVLRPEGRMREGAVFSSEARALPRQGTPSVAPPARLDPRFAAQVEAVLSRDEYPLHYKDFVRRYFLSLSEGAPPASAAPGETPR